jgi:hypothetical protein
LFGRLHHAIEPVEIFQADGDDTVGECGAEERLSQITAPDLELVVDVGLFQ